VLGVLIVVVGITVLVAHWPALSAEALSFDDTQYLTENPLVQNPGWASVGRFFGEVLEPSTVRGYYQPLSMISLMLDHAMGGRADNLRPFHRTSLGLHIANTALVIVLLYLLFRRVWVAAVVGLLFGLHPMTVEPIPWVGERKTLLAAFFALWSLVAYVGYARRGVRTWYRACLASFVLALMSKPTTTPLPLLLLLLDYWPLRRLNWGAVVQKIPFLLIAGISAVITVVSQGRTSSATMPGEYPLLHVPLILCHNIIFYLYKMVWPTNLCSHYPFPDPLALSDPMVLAGVVGTCMLIPALLLSWRRTRAPLVGWLFFFVAILPTMGVIGFTNVIASDKFAYLPSVGLMLPFAWCLGHIWSRTAGTPYPKAWRAMMVLAVALVVSAEGRATRRYLVYWRDTETLDRYMLGLAPSSPKLHVKLGNTLLSQGRPGAAVRYYRSALALRPDMFDGHHNLALALQRQGKIEEAIQHCRAAMRSQPDQRLTHLVHISLGGCLLELGRTDKAVRHFRAALRLKPDDVNAHVGLGLALLRSQNLEEAGRQFVAALTLRPDNAGAHYNLGKVLSAQGQLDEAVDQYRRALPLAPDAPELHNNLALILVRLGKIDEAIAQYREVLRIEPGDSATRHALATLLARRGRYAEAADEYRAVLAFDSNDVDAHFGLACALSVMGEADQATGEFREALRIDPQHAGARQGLEALSAAPDQP
jgi:tetratricopeptide (TPR) repeat protein